MTPELFSPRREAGQDIATGKANTPGGRGVHPQIDVDFGLCNE